MVVVCIEPHESLALYIVWPMSHSYEHVGVLIPELLLLVALSPHLPCILWLRLTRRTEVIACRFPLSESTSRSVSPRPHNRYSRKAVHEFQCYTVQSVQVVFKPRCWQEGAFVCSSGEIGRRRGRRMSETRVEALWRGRLHWFVSSAIIVIRIHRAVSTKLRLYVHHTVQISCSPNAA